MSNNTDPVREEHEKFLRALGHLTMAWSDAESALYGVLRYYSGVTEEVARSIFSGTRASGMMGFIKAIADNTQLDAARYDDLKEIFARIATINTMRDKLVHHIDGSMIEFDDDDPTRRYVTNARRVSRLTKAETFKIDAAMVEAMYCDLRECCWRLVAHPDRKNNPFRRGCGPTGQPQPWRYIPPQPERSQEHLAQPPQAPPTQR